jgi:uncharacterized protein YcfL
MLKLIILLIISTLLLGCAKEQEINFPTRDSVDDIIEFFISEDYRDALDEGYTFTYDDIKNVITVYLDDEYIQQLTIEYNA